MQKITTSTKLKTGFIVIFFCLVFYTCLVPLRDPDLWFHIKMGELFVNNGLTFHEVFSYSAQGREMMPYEWLFQNSVYLLEKNFGLESIKYVTAFFATIQTGFIFLLLRRILKLNLLLSFILCIFFIGVTLEFITARPHLIAYTFFVAVTYLCLEYLKTGIKKWLIPIFPIIWIWSNLHGSMFLGTALLGSFSTVALLNYFFSSEKKSWLKKFQFLALSSFLSIIFTILPPLGFGQYKLLWTFFENRELLTRFISEWAPLSVNDFGYTFYLYSLILVFSAFISNLIWKKKFNEALILIPFLPFPFLAFIATRNLVLGTFALIIIFGWTLSYFSWPKTGFKKYIYILVIIASLCGMGWIISQKKLPQRMYYPVRAVNFIEQFNLQGRMFNEYGFGGYILYRLYPGRQVFFDGRTEMYLCCEMPDTLELALKKYESDENFKPVMDWIWNKYDISYVIMRSEKHSVLRKMGRILTEDPNWSLVYWDDDSMIYVKHNGKNDQLVQDLGAKAATPYNQNPFHEGQEDQAFEEYQRMIKVVDSSKSRNAIGFILLKKGKFAEASVEFKKAVSLDPTNESPYMNLAELAAKDKNYPEAINLYEQALNLAPDRGLIYIRLGQLYLQNGEDLSKAKDTWQKGVENTVDEDAKAKLNDLLSR